MIDNKIHSRITYHNKYSIIMNTDNDNNDTTNNKYSIVASRTRELLDVDTVSTALLIMILLLLLLIIIMIIMIIHIIAIRVRVLLVPGDCSEGRRPWKSCDPESCDPNWVHVENTHTFPGVVVDTPGSKKTTGCTTLAQTGLAKSSICVLG